MYLTREFSVQILQPLLPSFFQLLKILLQLISEPNSWPPLIASLTFSLSSLMLCPQMDLQSPNLVSHLLLTQSGPPVFTKACPLNPEKLASTKAEFSTIWLRRRMAVGVHAEITEGAGGHGNFESLPSHRLAYLSSLDFPSAGLLLRKLWRVQANPLPGHHTLMLPSVRAKHFTFRFQS